MGRDVRKRGWKGEGVKEGKLRWNGDFALTEIDLNIVRVMYGLF